MERRKTRKNKNLTVNYIITKNPDYFRKIGSYNFCELSDMELPDKIAIDTETTGLTPRNCEIFCVQIGTGKDNYIIHMYDYNYQFSDLVPFINGKVLVGHNITFDLGFMYKYNFWPKEVRDTMVATKVLYNGQLEKVTSNDGHEAHIFYKADFGTVMRRELGAEYDKTEQKNIHIVKLSQPSTIEYSFNDVDRLLELEEFMYQKIVAGGFKETYLLHCRYTRALAYIEQCGLPISSQKWKAKMEVDVNNVKEFQEMIEEYIFDHLPQFANRQMDLFDTKKRINVSLGSGKQMLKVFNAFGIPTKDKDGKDSIEADIISKSKHEFVKKWLEFQNANHRVTTFGESIYKKIEHERIYTNFNISVDTARISTRRGEINFLNFPKDEETRNCFVANPGNKMIVCDYSGQETVIAADLSGDKAMTDSAVNGNCLHCAFARILFPEIAHLDDATITKQHKDKRQAAKSPRFAFQYGGSAFTIHQNQGIPLEEAEKIEIAFKELHQGIYVWGDKVYEHSVKQGYIESVDGWRLALPDFDRFNKLKAIVEAITRDEWRIYKTGKLDYLKKFEEAEKGIKYEYKYPRSVEYYKSKKMDVSKFFKLKSEYLRLCLNNPVQTRGAHQIKLAACILFDWIVENHYQWKVKICNSVHDELVIEATDELAEEACKAVEKAMLVGGDYYLSNIKIKADAHIGDSWGEAKGA